MNSVTVPALSLGDCALAPRTVHGRVDDTALAVTRQASLLPTYGLVNPSGAADRSWERRLHLERPFAVALLALPFAGRHEARCDCSRSHGSRYWSHSCYGLMTALLLLTARGLG